MTIKKPINLNAILYADNKKEADEIIHNLVNNYIYVVATGETLTDEGIKIEIYMEVVN